MRNLRPAPAVFALALLLALPAVLAQEPASEAEPAAETVERRVPEGGKVTVGHIDGEINLAASAYVKRLVETATEAESAVLMLELNTFGGRIDAAVLIRDALIDAPMHTAVFINKRAISAGALISLACHSIAISPGGTIGAATPVSGDPTQEVSEAVEEKYLSYFRQEMRSTAETRGRNGDLAAAMVDRATEVPGVIEEGKLLTLTTQTALEHQMADVEATSLEEALAALGLDGPTEVVDHTWSETLVGFLTSSAIASLLMLGMMALGYLELQTPGFGVFGAGALTCLLLLYFSHYLVDLAGYEELLLFTVGAILLIVEVIAVPGFGLLGLAGLICMLASSVMLLMAGDWSDVTFHNPFTLDAVTRVSISLALTVVVLALLIRYATFDARSPLGRRLILAQGLDAAAGYTSHEQGADLVGQTGSAVTPLRPAGKARIGDKRWNVETEGDFIDRGETVRVLRQEPGRIVVRRA